MAQIKIDKDIKVLLQSESEQLEKLQNIVKKALDDENLTIDNLLHPLEEVLTMGKKYLTKLHGLVEVGLLSFHFLSY